MNKETALRKIGKLLKMAADVSSPEEAARAAGMARKLMDKFNVESFDPDKTVLTFDMFQTRSWKVLPRWVGPFAVGISTYNNVLAHTSEILSEKGTRVLCVRFRGEESDVKMCEYLFTMLEKAVKDDRKKFMREQGLPNNTSGMTHNFESGFANTVCNRLLEMAKQRTADANAQGGNALVVIGNRMSAVEDHYGQAQGHVKGKARRCTQAAARALQAGKAAGALANINRPIGSSREASGTKLLG